jgi:hypothetical protein
MYWPSLKVNVSSMLRFLFGISIFSNLSFLFYMCDDSYLLVPVGLTAPKAELDVPAADTSNWLADDLLFMSTNDSAFWRISS